MTWDLASWFGAWLNLSDKFSWRASHYLFILLGLPVVVLLIHYGFKVFMRRLSIAQRVVRPEARWEMSTRIRVIKMGMLAGVFALIVIASAGPRLGWKWVESSQQGMDIVVAIDVSKSMNSDDLTPSRLERARRMVLDLLDVSSGDRIGLVFFAGTAFVQCPLTTDHGALASFLDDMDSDLIPVGGTNLGAALKESLRALGAGGQNSGQGLGKLIIVLSDGEDHEGALDQAIQEVVESKAKVISVGVGTISGGPIREKAGGFLKDSDGNVVITKLQDVSLRRIAEKTGGEYIRADASARSVASIYSDIIVQSGSVREQRILKDRQWYERYQWPGALALLLLVIEIFILDTSRKVHLFVFLYGGILLASPTKLDAASDRNRYNAAVSAKDTDDIDREKVFSELSKSSDKEVARRALYNLGTILSNKGRYEEAVNSFEQALSINSQDQQARDNLQWAKERMQRQKSEQQKDQQQKDQQQKDQQQKDQQQKDQQQKDQQQKDQQQKDQQQKDQQQKDQQQKDQQQKDQQQKDQQPDFDNVDRLLRSVPDDRKTSRPLYRSDPKQQKNHDRDW